MEESTQNNIKCPIFCESDEVIKSIILRTGKVNPKEKRQYIQDILIETRFLLQCSHYDAVNTDCLNCHSIARKYAKEYGPAQAFFVRDISNSSKM